MKFSDLKVYLDEKADQYNDSNFIENDPIQIPHRFNVKQDIEIAGFLAATIAWGNRKSIISSANKMMDFMGNSPYDFVMNAQESDFEILSSTNELYSFWARAYCEEVNSVVFNKFSILEGWVAS